MICEVIVRKEGDKFVARVKEWPEITAKDKIREKALNKVKSLLLDYLTDKVEIVKIDVPVTREARNPWLDYFGFFKDDPTFDDLQAQIALFRNKIDESEADG